MFSSLDSLPAWTHITVVQGTQYKAFGCSVSQYGAVHVYSADQLQCGEALLIVRVFNSQLWYRSLAVRGGAVSCYPEYSGFGYNNQSQSLDVLNKQSFVIFATSYVIGLQRCFRKIL